MGMMSECAEEAERSQVLRYVQIIISQSKDLEELKYKLDKFFVKCDPIDSIDTAVVNKVLNKVGSR